MFAPSGDLTLSQGATGKFVRIHLPGSNRIFSGTVFVNRAKPEAKQVDQMVCYAVEAAASSATSPEFVISEDPMDPIFYSSCYVRERNIEWVTPVVAPPPPPEPKFGFGAQCLACSSFDENRQPTTSTMIPPVWTMNKHCITCAGDVIINGTANVACPTTTTTTTKTSSTTTTRTTYTGTTTGTTTTTVTTFTTTTVTTTTVSTTTTNYTVGRQSGTGGDKKGGKAVGIFFAVLICLGAVGVIIVCRRELKSALMNVPFIAARYTSFTNMPETVVNAAYEFGESTPDDTMPAVTPAHYEEPPTVEVPHVGIAPATTMQVMEESASVGGSSGHQTPKSGQHTPTDNRQTIMLPEMLESEDTFAI